MELGEKNEYYFCLLNQLRVRLAVFKAHYPWHLRSARGQLLRYYRSSDYSSMNTLESTQTRILSLFPANLQGNASLCTLAERADALAQANTLSSRLDALVELFLWLRERDDYMPEPLCDTTPANQWGSAEWKRERVWISILETSPEIRMEYHAAIASILEETDGVSLFAQSGLPSDRGLFSEMFERFFRIVLPAPRNDSDLSKLLLRLFPTQKEVDRFSSLPPGLSERLALFVAPPENSPAWRVPIDALLEAFCLLGARVQGLGLSEKIRLRSTSVPVQQSPFYQLAHASDDLVTAMRNRTDVHAAAQVWKGIAEECRAELSTVESHLEQWGVNLDVVYALDVIEKSLNRMEIISGVLVAPSGPAKIVTVQRLMREVIRGRISDRSLRQLAHNNFRLLAKKIVEWAGKTGEHYITNNGSEYRQMWRAALGGGLLTVGTAAIKLVVSHAGLPPFVEGFFASLNYAVSFVLMQNFHLALATKQPSMTGAALAQIIHECRHDANSDKLVSFSARIVRSQLAAALGNILAVCAGGIVFSLLWRVTTGGPFLDEETARYAISSLNPIRSGTIFYAIITGVILWLSSLAGGWIENWVVYHQLPRAIGEHRLGKSFDPEKLRRFSNSFSRNIAGWGGSIFLGFMLGMTPQMRPFFGVPLDVRHVTLSTGTVALGAASLRWSAVGQGALLMAGLGIACTFVLNLGVSFYLALKLALRAQDVSPADHLEIFRTLRRRFFSSPREFFIPPVEPADSPAQPSH